MTEPQPPSEPAKNRQNSLFPKEKEPREIWLKQFYSPLQNLWNSLQFKLC